MESLATITDKLRTAMESLPAFADNILWFALPAAAIMVLLIILLILFGPRSGTNYNSAYTSTAAPVAAPPVVVAGPTLAPQATVVAPVLPTPAAAVTPAAVVTPARAWTLSARFWWNALLSIVGFILLALVVVVGIKRLPTIIDAFKPTPAPPVGSSEYSWDFRLPGDAVSKWDITTTELLLLWLVIAIAVVVIIKALDAIIHHFGWAVLATIAGVLGAVALAVLFGPLMVEWFKDLVATSPSLHWWVIAILVAITLVLLAYVLSDFSLVGIIRRGLLATAGVILLLIMWHPFVTWYHTPSAPHAPVVQQAYAPPAKTVYPGCNRINTIEVSNDPDGKPINKGARCSSRLKLASETGCIQVKVWGERKWRPQTFCKGTSNVPIPDDVEYIRSARPEVLTVKVTLLGPIFN